MERGQPALAGMRLGGWDGLVRPQSLARVGNSLSTAAGHAEELAPGGRRAEGLLRTRLLEALGTCAHARGILVSVSKFEIDVR